MEALRTCFKELQMQQDLQAGALRDGLMEIHQQRADLLDLKRCTEVARGSSSAGDVVAEVEKCPQEEKTACTAELNSRLQTPGEQQEDVPCASAAAGGMGAPASLPFLEEKDRLMREALDRAQEAFAATERLAAQLAEVAQRGEITRQELLQAVAAVPAARVVLTSGETAAAEREATAARVPMSPPIARVPGANQGSPGVGADAKSCRTPLLGLRLSGPRTPDLASRAGRPPCDSQGALPCEARGRPELSAPGATCMSR